MPKGATPCGNNPTSSCISCTKNYHRWIIVYIRKSEKASSHPVNCQCCFDASGAYTQWQLGARMMGRIRYLKGRAPASLQNHIKDTAMQDAHHTTDSLWYYSASFPSWKSCQHQQHMLPFTMSVHCAVYLWCTQHKHLCYPLTMKTAPDVYWGPLLPSVDGWLNYKLVLRPPVCLMEEVPHIVFFSGKYIFYTGL